MLLLMCNDDKTSSSLQNSGLLESIFVTESGVLFLVYIRDFGAYMEEKGCGASCHWHGFS